MTIDTETLREIASFQDFAEHADSILAAAMTLDDLVLQLDRIRDALTEIENRSHVYQLNSKWERSYGYKGAAKMLRAAMGGDS